MGPISWQGVAYCSAGAALWWLGDLSCKGATHLQSVRRTTNLEELAALLTDAGKNGPIVAAVCGRVGAENPIVTGHGNLRTVMLDQTAEQHFLKQNESGSWVQQSVVLLANSKEVPWFLEDGPVRVHVVGARSASGLELQVASESFEESGRSAVRGTLDYLQGLKMLGVKRVERVLPVGTRLTAVGEVVRDDRLGTLRLQRPPRGPFVISQQPLEQLIASLGSWSKLYQFCAGACALAGVVLLVRQAWRHRQEKRRIAAIEARMRDHAGARERASGVAAASGGSAADGADSKRDCVVCMEQPYTTVLVPCGHMCCCYPCTQQLAQQRCPLCRRKIEQVVRNVYRH